MIYRIPRTPPFVLGRGRTPAADCRERPTKRPGFLRRVYQFADPLVARVYECHRAAGDPVTIMEDQ